jgi:hypothetical protein
LDLGCPLVLKNQTNRSYLKNDNAILQLDKILVNTCLKEEYVGQSPIYLVALDLFEELIDKMLKMDKANFHLKTYYVGYDCGKINDEERYVFSPIILGLLRYHSYEKDQNFLLNFAKIIKKLIINGYDINLPAYYGNTNLQHNITDYLHYYGYVYPDSPVLKVFLDLLPKQLDPNFENFRERGISVYESKYDIVIKKYKYLKDPNKYYLIFNELEDLLNKGVLENDLQIDDHFSNIPGLNDLVNRINQFGRQTIQNQQQTNYGTRRM